MPPMPPGGVKVSANAGTIPDDFKPGAHLDLSVGPGSRISNPATHHIAARTETLGECLIDDDRVGSRQRVSICESATGENSDSEHIEKIRRDGIGARVGQRLISRDGVVRARGVSLHFNRGASLRAGEMLRVGRTREPRAPPPVSATARSCGR